MLRYAIAFCLAAAMAGCTTQSKARARAGAAYSVGRQQGFNQAQTSAAPIILVQGNVSNSRVAWSEGLTLAQAIVAAEYRGVTNPRRIFVRRGGQRNFVDPQQLLAGRDFILEAGDIVEIE